MSRWWLLTLMWELSCISFLNTCILLLFDWCQLPEAPTLGWRDESLMASAFCLFSILIVCISLFSLMSVAWSSCPHVVWRGFWCHSTRERDWEIHTLNVCMPSQCFAFCPLLSLYYWQCCWCVPINCRVASLTVQGFVDDFCRLGQCGSSFMCMWALPVMVRTIFYVHITPASWDSRIRDRSMIMDTSFCSNIIWFCVWACYLSSVELLGECEGIMYACNGWLSVYISSPVRTFLLICVY